MKDHSMDDFKQRILRIIRYTLFLLSFFIIGMLTPYSKMFSGLALGTFVSLLNTIYTAWKVNKIGEFAVSAKNHLRRRPHFSGMLTRFANSILAVMLVYQYPQHIHLISTLFGLFVTQIVTIVDGIINTKREKENKLSTRKG
ncbi:ATP synthase subunit I [Tepidibacillus fermentans]|uniref:ATP synthase protein I n=1 Tax=Tepidibacillus fermentans TaxID=1281767 RepID=A0A4R3KIK9_9BACI|nr:ATP synthase subunit I [Tepidibacillus fermentans]TCS83410.1 ATP synthase protein I [Tepidibacillus fermentans]